MNNRKATSGVKGSLISVSTNELLCEGNNVYKMYQGNGPSLSVTTVSSGESRGRVSKRVEFHEMCWSD